MSTRPFLFSASFFLILLNAASAQELKFNSTTLKKTIEGAAPIASLKYETCFKKKKNQELSIDSVKSVADGKLIPFAIYKNTSTQKYAGTKIKRGEKGSFRLNFGIIQLLSDEHLPYSEDNRPVQYDMSKGINIYYTLAGKNKNSILTDFKELPQEARP